MWAKQLFNKAMLATLLFPLAAPAAEHTKSGNAPAAAAEQPAAPAPSQHAVESRLANVGRLVTVSSGAKKIQSSGNADAIALYTEARGHYDEAKGQFAAGEIAAANKSLGEATKVMFKAVRAAGKVQAIEDYHRRVFVNRDESVKALLAALKRINQEKGGSEEANHAIVSVETMAAEARSLAESGEVDAARKILDTAYITTKTTIEKLRGGETLVRTLNFASPEEEYVYEIDRNDTHQMLVKVFVMKKGVSQGVKAMVDKFVERAMSLRADAEKQAGGGDHPGAIDALEESTKQLIRAIRAGGLYIPG